MMLAYDDPVARSTELPEKFFGATGDERVADY